MADEGPTTVGSINAKVVLDIDELIRNSEKAIAQVDKLDGRNAAVHVHADGTERAIAQLNAVGMAANKYRIAQLDLDTVMKRGTATEQDRLRAENALNLAAQGLAKARLAEKQATSEGTTEVIKHTEAVKREEAADRAQAQAQQGSNIAMSAFIAMAPVALGASAALAGGATALGMGFVGMGASLMLAIKGANTEMTAGTAAGWAFNSNLDVLQGSFSKLTTVASGQVLEGFYRATQSVSDHMPFLASIVKETARDFADMGATLVGNLLQGLERMGPLIRAGASSLSDFVGWLGHFAQEQGFRDFVAYAVANLPQTVRLVEQLVELAGRLIAAFAPIGSQVVQALTGLVSVFNSFPLPVLAGITTMATTASVALKIMSSEAISAGIKEVATSIGLAGVALKLAVPVAGLVLSALAGLATAFWTEASATKSATVEAEDFAEALRQDNDVVGENTQKVIANKLAKDGTIDAAHKLGITTADLTGYLAGNASSVEQVNHALKLAADHYQQLGAKQQDAKTGTADLWKQQQDVLEASKKVQDSIHTYNDALTEEQKVQQQTAEATGISVEQLQKQNDAARMGAEALGITQLAYDGAKNAADQQAASTAQATLAMQLQNDAAGLLKQALDGLNGSHLSLAQAETAQAAAINGVTKSMQQNGKAITGNSDAAVANQQALQGAASAAQNHAEAVAKATGSTEAGIQTYREAKTALENQMRSQGLLTDKVQDYINKIFDVDNLKPKPTKIEADTSQAEAALARVQSAIDSLHDKTVNVITRNSTMGGQDFASTSPGGESTGAEQPHQNGGPGSWQGYALGGAVRYLAGGGIGDPYARGTDTVHAMLTPEEQVIRRSSANQVRRDHPGALEYINATGRLPAQQSGPVVVRPVIQVFLDGRDITANMVTKIQQEIDSAFDYASQLRPR